MGWHFEGSWGAKAPKIRWWKGAIVLRLGVHPSIAGGMGFPRSPEMDRVSFSHSEHLPGSSKGLPFLPAQASGEVLGEIVLPFLFTTFSPLF